MQCASLKPSCWSRYLMLSHLQSAFFYIGLAIFISSSGHGASTQIIAEPATIMIEGNNFGRKYCSSPDRDGKIDVKLPKIAVDAHGLVYRVQTPSKKAEGKLGVESYCDKSAPLGTKELDVAEDIAKIDATEFLHTNACGAEGKNGQLALCIYESGGEKSLVAYAPFTFNTKTPKFERIDNVSAYNGEISFDV